jgi:hypothetical protein
MNRKIKIKNKMKKLMTILGVAIFASVLLTSYGRRVEEKNKIDSKSEEVLATVENTKNHEIVSRKKEEKHQKTKAEYQYILGKWNGTLRDKKLTIVIESISGNNVVGYNIAGKNKRPLSGKIYADDRNGDGECMGNMSAYKLLLKEPGDDKWDGTYTLYFGDCPEFDQETDKIISHSYSVYGSWRAFTGKLSGNVYLTK